MLYTAFEFEYCRKILKMFSALIGVAEELREIRSYDSWSFRKKIQRNLSKGTYMLNCVIAVYSIMIIDCSVSSGSRTHYVKVKVKVHPVTGPEGPRGGLEV
jgi:hypothetical protein